MPRRSKIGVAKVRQRGGAKTKSEISASTGPDARSSEQSRRSRLMARVKSEDTAPELAVRHALWIRGYRYRLHAKGLPGRPDIVIPRYRVAAFVHGCFWHGCMQCDRGLRRPKSNAAFWEAKLADNRARDARNIAALRGLGWRVAVFWECTVRDKQRLETAIDELHLNREPIRHGG